MDTRITAKYFIGDSKKNKWASVYTYKPQSPEIFNEKGEVFSVISLNAEDEEDFDSINAGNLLLDRFHESYFESKKESVLEAITSAITSVRDLLTELMKGEESLKEKGVDFDIAVVVVRGKEVFFASFGSAKILLLQSENSEEYIDITSMLRDPYAKGLTRIGSSYTKPDQRFMLVTDSALKELGKEETIQTLISFNDLRIKNYDFEKSENAAVLLVGYDLESKPDSEFVVGKKPQEKKTLKKTIEDTIEEQVTEKDLEDMETSAPHKSDLNPVSPDNPANPVSPDNPEIRFDSTGDKSAVESKTTKSELEPGIEDAPTEPRPQPADQIKEKLKIAAEKAKFYAQKLIGKIKSLSKGSKIKNLQQKREQAAELSKDPTQQPAFNPRTIDPNESTIKVILKKIQFKLIDLKDIILYDILKINNRGRLTFSKDSPEFKIAILAATIILILVALGIIRSIGENRARQEQIDQAVAKLTLIEEDIDAISSSPLLNPRSTQDIPQREALLGTIKEIEAKFTDELNILPEEEINTPREELAELKRQILKQKNVDLQLLTDVGNLFEGNITDFTETNGNLYILDGTKGSIYRQPKSGGNAELLVDGLKSPTAISADGDGNLVVYTQDDLNVIAVVNPATKEVTKVPGISADKLSLSEQLAVYEQTNGVYAITPASSNVYLLNKTSGSSYALPNIRYSNDELGQLSDIEIVDAKIFLLSSTQGLYRVESEGQRMEAFSEMLQAVKSSRSFGYDEEYVYVADSTNSRILVFTKSRGNSPIFDYVAQLKLEGIEGNIVELTADKAEGKIFVATDRQIFTINRSSILSQ